MIAQRSNCIIISVLFIFFLVFLIGFEKANAQKNESGEKQATQTAINEGIEEANKSISNLTKKIYAISLFSPEDNDELIGLKLNLYNLWTKNPTNRELAKPMLETALILKSREMYDEAIEFLNIIIENFPPDEELEEENASIDYSAKAQSALNKLRKDLEEQ